MVRKTLFEWQGQAETMASGGTDAHPDWSQSGLPRCAYDECPSYDGKRCRLLGSRPSHVCEPVADAMAALLTSAEGEKSL